MSRRDYTIPNADTRNAKLGGQQRIPCKNYSKTICYYGVNCRYDHPRICESWTEMGSCPGVNGSCKKPHPMICRSFSDRVECRRRYCKFIHPRSKKWRNNKNQQVDSSRSHGRNQEKAGYSNDGYRATHNQHRGTNKKPFLHHQGAGQYKRRMFPPHQGEGHYTEGRTRLMGGEMDLQRATVREWIREELEMMKGNREYHAGY